MENAEIIKQIKELLKGKSYKEASLLLEAIERDIKSLAIIPH